MVFRAFAWSHRIPLPGPLARENEKRERFALRKGDAWIIRW
jgi:hypothetical protein